LSRKQVWKKRFFKKKKKIFLKSRLLGSSKQPPRLRMGGFVAVNKKINEKIIRIENKVSGVKSEITPILP